MALFTPKGVQVRAIDGCVNLKMEGVYDGLMPAESARALGRALLEQADNADKQKAKQPQVHMPPFQFGKAS